MSCHAILKNLYEPKMDVILTIIFKITAEIEIKKNICFASYFAEEDVYRRFVKFVKHNYVVYVTNPLKTPANQIQDYIGGKGTFDIKRGQK